MAERKSRIEQILQYALGRESSLPPRLSRIEKLLVELIDEIMEIEGKTILSIGGRVDTVEELPLDAEEGSLYFVGYVSSTDKAEYVMTSTGDWEMLGFSTLIVDSELSSTSANPVMNRVVKAALDNKVEIVIGKQLSTNDYTTAEKTKLSNCKTVWEGTQTEYNALVSKIYDLYMIYEDEEETEEENQNGD